MSTCRMGVTAGRPCAPRPGPRSSGSGRYGHRVTPSMPRWAQQGLDHPPLGVTEVRCRSLRDPLHPVGGFYHDPVRVVDHHLPLAGQVGQQWASTTEQRSRHPGARCTSTRDRGGSCQSLTTMTVWIVDPRATLGEAPGPGGGSTTGIDHPASGSTSRWHHRVRSGSSPASTDDPLMITVSLGDLPMASGRRHRPGGRTGSPLTDIPTHCCSSLERAGVARRQVLHQQSRPDRLTRTATEPTLPVPRSPTMNDRCEVRLSRRHRPRAILVRRATRCGSEAPDQVDEHRCIGGPMIVGSRRGRRDRTGRGGDDSTPLLVPRTSTRPPPPSRLRPRRAASAPASPSDRHPGRRCPPGRPHRLRGRPKSCSATRRCGPPSGARRRVP